MRGAPAMKAMKAMKARAAMKAPMKAKKAMKVSKVAKGKRARAVVFRGGKEKTSSGMTKDKLTKNPHGKIVSKAASARAKKAYGGRLGKWTKAVQQAKKALGIKGFAIIGGKTPQGQALHAKA